MMVLKVTKDIRCRGFSVIEIKTWCAFKTHLKLEFKL